MPTLTTSRILRSSVSLSLDFFKNNLVLGFSYYKLLTSYSGYCVRVRRSSDNATQDFSFVNNYIDYASIVYFCGAGDGFVTIWYNQYVSGNNASQTINSNQPKIVTNGVFESNGINFISGSSCSLKILDYSALSIIDEPLSLYGNIYPISNTDGYVMSRCYWTTSTSHYGIIRSSSSPSTSFVYSGGIKLATITCPINSNTKVLYNWINKNTDGFVSNTSNGNVITTLNTSLTNRTNTHIGARSDNADGSRTETYYVGNIKTICIFNSNVSYDILSKV